jgi:hypothetical protein
MAKTRLSFQAVDKAVGWSATFFFLPAPHSRGIVGVLTRCWAARRTSRTTTCRTKAGGHPAGHRPYFFRTAATAPDWLPGRQPYGHSLRM